MGSARQRAKEADELQDAAEAAAAALHQARRQRPHSPPLPKVLSPARAGCLLPARPCAPALM